MRLRSALWLLLVLSWLVMLLPIYFLMTAPMTLTLMAWMHRRWLAGVELALLAALLVALGARLRPRRAGAGTTAAPH